MSPFLCRISSVHLYFRPPMPYHRHCCFSCDVERLRYAVHNPCVMSGDVQYTSTDSIDDKLTLTSALHTNKRLFQLRVLRTMVKTITNNSHYLFIRSRFYQRFIHEIEESMVLQDSHSLFAVSVISKNPHMVLHLKMMVGDIISKSVALTLCHTVTEFSRRHQHILIAFDEWEVLKIQTLECEE